MDLVPGRMPYLTWRWKVTQLPGGGDFRRTTTDDQAAQVLVAFDDNRVITYIWDSTAPKGIAQPANSFPFLHIFAVVYGRPAPRVKGLRLQINSQHTGSVAESYFGEVAFRSTPE